MTAEKGSLERGTSARDEVAAAVKAIVAEQLGAAPESIEERHDLEGDLGADSLTLVEIMMEVEEHFDVTVPDEAGSRIRTVGQIVDGVWGLLGNAGG